MSGRERPILFSGPMVRAILEGRKTQTRRVIKPRKHASLFDGTWADEYVLDPGNEEWRQEEVRFAVGDRLWVREAFSYDRLDIDKDGVLPPWYWADGNPDHGDWTKPKPSIHMPRWASRITLQVTGVKVERLQDISEEDAKAEGARFFPDIPIATAMYHINRWSMEDAPPNTDHCLSSAYWAFANFWGKINGKGAWDANPWVVAVIFKRLPSPASGVTG